MPGTPLLIVALALVAGSAVIQGMVGFGFNILVVPLLALFIDPKVVVPTVILHNVLLDCVVLASAWRFANLRRIWVLVLAGMVSTPVGVILLGVVNPEPLRIFIGLAVVASGTALLMGVQRTLSNEYAASAVAGSMGGAMNGLVGMPGPPVILLFANQGMEPREFRANIVTYFTVITFIAVGSYWLHGALTRDVLVLTLVTLPATAVGVLFGIRLHGRVSVEAFLRVSLVLVILAGSSALVAGLVSL
jgi:uncharacterized membrane protein YfcA